MSRGGVDWIKLASGFEQVTGFCEHDNESLDSVRVEFLDQLSDCKFPIRHSFQLSESPNFQKSTLNWNNRLEDLFHEACNEHCTA
jgi:hypothetical protein